VRRLLRQGLLRGTYKQIFKIQVELPETLSDKDRQGVLRAIERCTVKKVVQEGPTFEIEAVNSLDADSQAMLIAQPDSDSETFIEGKDLPLEQTIANMTAILAELGMKIEVSSWRNIVPNVWSLNIRDAASHILQRPILRARNRQRRFCALPKREVV